MTSRKQPDYRRQPTQRQSTLEQKAAQVATALAKQGWQVDVRLSRRRKKTVGVRQEGEGYVLLAPSSMGVDRLVSLANELLEKVERKSAGSRKYASDNGLEELARHINRQFLDGNAQWESIVWVENMSTRWGSCTTATGRIRISHRLQQVPDYVLQSVVLHELVHTWIPNHSAEFWRWAKKTPHFDRARGYLEAYQRWGTSS